MWIAVTGDLATGKRLVAKFLEKKGYKYFDQSATRRYGVHAELEWLALRAEQQLEAQSDPEKDFVTIRSVWDQREVFWPALTNSTALTSEDLLCLDRVWQLIEPRLKPPTMIISLLGRKIDSYARMDLTGRPHINEAFYDHIKSLNEVFLKKVAIPVVEIDASLKVDALLDTVDYSVASIKASKLSDTTIWTKKFYR